MATDKPYQCVLLFGAPGVGKGTQGKRLGKQSGFVHLATGDIFRSLDKESELGQKFLVYSSRGELVPDDLTVELWQNYVRGLIARRAFDPNSDILLLDGIPRSVNQAKMLDPYLKPLRILHLTAPSIDEMVQRMKRRAEEEGRHDDANEAVIRRRFEVYEEETAPVLKHYDASLIREIDALGTVDEVAERVRNAVSDM